MTLKSYARVVAGKAVEVVTPPMLDPQTQAPLSDCYHPDVAVQFVECPAGTLPGASFDGAAWTAPTPAPTPAPRHALLSPMQFYLAFTPAERVLIKGSNDALVKEFWATYELAAQLGQSVDPNLSSVSEGLDYLVTMGCIVSARKADILAGVPQ